MKKLFLLMMSIITCNSMASQVGSNNAAGSKKGAEVMKPWSDFAITRFMNGLTAVIHIGKSIPNYESNAVYTVCVSMQEGLKTTAPQQLAAAPLAVEFLETVAKTVKYKEALSVAVQKHTEALANADDKSKAEEATKTWAAFRMAAAGALTEVVEQRSEEQVGALKGLWITPFGPRVMPLKFNRGQENIKDIFIVNPFLLSHDVSNLEAAQLSLYGLWDVQERAKKEAQKVVK